MSFDNPLRINMCSLVGDDWKDVVLKKNVEATHVEFCFHAVQFGTPSTMVTFSENGLLQSPDDIVTWVGKFVDYFPQLSHVRIITKHKNPGSAGWLMPHFPVAALSEIFSKRGDKLLSLDLALGCDVVGTKAEFQDSMNVLKTLQNLRVVGLYGDDADGLCVGAEWRVTGTNGHGSQAGQEWLSKALLETLIGLGNLKKLLIPSAFKMDLTDLTQLIANASSLECLRMNLYPNSNLNNIDMLQNSIENNSSLKELRLVQRRPGFTSSMEALLEGLAKNKALVSLVLFCCSVIEFSDTHHGKLCASMKTNRTLMRIKIDGMHHFRLMDRDPVTFYLKMNRLGRKALLDDLDSELWRSTLVDQKEDHQVVFYLLSHNIAAYIPALLEAVEQPQKKKPKTI